MTMVISNTNHTEIDVRYAWLRREQKLDRGSPRLIARVRMREIERVFVHRYGGALPNDDAGLDDLELAAHHIALLDGNAEQHILAWASVWAPWLSRRKNIDAKQFATRIAANPRRFKADTLAWRLRLTMADRTRLGITTIGAIDCNAQMRAAQRHKRKRIAETKRRRAAGSVTREESAAQKQPWIAMKMSRATWYRKGKPMPETNAGTADGVSTMASTNSSHSAVSPCREEAFRDEVRTRCKASVPFYKPEYPVAAVDHRLAANWLRKELGADETAIGIHRFAFLERELVAGQLYLSVVRAASNGIRKVAA